MEAKKQEQNPNPHEVISLYKVSILDNPLVHPRTRERIMEKKDDPAIQRQYFNNWSASSDELFKPNVIDEIHDIKNPNYLKQ